MILAETPSVQWWTLGVAVLAGLASGGGIKFAAFFSQQTEHKTWQRDLRVRIYSETTSCADRMMQLLTSYSANVHVRSIDDAERERIELAHVAEYRALRMELSGRVNDVQTFGSLKVGAASVALGQGLILSLREHLG
jgi:hypothetical protein